MDANATLSGPLATTTWLDDHLGDVGLRVADCRWYLGEPARGVAEYHAGHIPGAVYVSLDDDLSAPEGAGRHPLPRPADYARRLGELGFGDDHTIVAYDDRGGAVAARMWWMLRAIGHPRVAVLDGGLTAWLAEERATTTMAGSYEAARLSVHGSGVTIDGDALERRLGAVTLVDARDADRYRGEREPVDPVAGHIPTAISLPLGGNLRADLRFADPGVLRKRFLAAGVTPDRETVVYCGSGVTACHDILAMELAGLPAATLYPGSWSDWSTTRRAVATGSDPGTR
jgi:thiosulfate/3-mercaptopyruvate sulfurtransferase